jgi:hypothetical protein
MIEGKPRAAVAVPVVERNLRRVVFIMVIYIKSSVSGARLKCLVK